MLTNGQTQPSRYRLFQKFNKFDEGGIAEINEISRARRNARFVVTEHPSGENRLRATLRRQSARLAKLNRSALPRVPAHFVEGDGLPEIIRSHKKSSPGKPFGTGASTVPLAPLRAQSNSP